MINPRDIVFLFDVDNTLLNNDAVQLDLRNHLETNFGVKASDRYWELFEELRSELGYTDYLGALERYRLEELHNPRVLRIANWLADYPFADRFTRVRWMRFGMPGNGVSRSFCRTATRCSSLARWKLQACGGPSMTEC